MMRAAGGAPGTQFLVATVPPGRPPLEFKRHGLRNLPAVISCGEGLDTVEEIIDFIAVKPDTATQANNVADTVATDFFSKFCFFIKVTTGCLNIFVNTKIFQSMSRDSRALEARLEAALSRLDQLLASLPSTSPFLAGPDLGQLDCELLPKVKIFFTLIINKYVFSFQISNKIFCSCTTCGWRPPSSAVTTSRPRCPRCGATCTMATTTPCSGEPARPTRSIF